MITKSEHSVRTSLPEVAAACAIILALLFTTRVSPAHASFAAFLGAMFACAWLMSRGSFDSIEVRREHRPRVFENDHVPVTIALRQHSGLPRSMILVEDQFFASLSIRQRHLVPMMTRRWEAHLHYAREAERHRGLYLLGPVWLWAADPLGLIAQAAEVDCVTQLTVYPRAVPLPNYQLLGPNPPPGATMESFRRTGQGEQILGVRPLRRGDSPARVHWRTSARRGELHVIETDSHVQTTVMLFLDLTRRSKFGTGSESTTETAIGCACAVLTQAASLRHRIGMVVVREVAESIPPGEGMAHLHLLLDRLAVVSALGELDFVETLDLGCAPLKSGSRAIIITPATTNSGPHLCTVVNRLTQRGVSADVILLDETRMTRIWRDQAPPLAAAAENFARLKKALEHSGARVIPLERGESASELVSKT